MPDDPDDDPDDEPVPWRLGTSQCGAYPPRAFRGIPGQCQRPVTHAGLILRKPDEREAWIAFACDEHARRLIAARPLLPRDDAIRQDWARREHDALNRLPWRPPGPLATGADARALIARARAWDPYSA